MFTIRIVVALPNGDHDRTLVAQGSPPVLLAGAGVKVGCKIDDVGNEIGVLDGGGNGLAVSVGGKGVEVGTAACVSATMVNAAATAVNCTSAGSIVGTASAPQALMITVNAATNEEMVKRFMFLNILLMDLTVGETSSLSHDTFISYNNCPASLRDAETAEHFEILLAVYKCAGAILSNRPAETAIGFELLTEIPAFSQLCYHIQGERNCPFRLGFVG